MRKKLSIIIFGIVAMAALAFAVIYFSPSAKKEIRMENELPKQSELEEETEAAAIEEDVLTPIDLDSLSVEEETAEKEDIPASVPDTASSKNKPVAKDSSEKENSGDAEKSSGEKSFKISDKLADWGYSQSSGRKIDTVVIHSSYNSLGGDVHSLEKILDIYKSYGVSPHYIISREGKVYRLVSDKNVAYHAGVSEVPDGRENVNNFSIGIEIINTKSESPSAAEYSALEKLLEYLKGKYKIKYVLGHSDIAPGRKDDPWKFDWGKVR